jgi:hypothetical protein
MLGTSSAICMRLVIPAEAGIQGPRVPVVPLDPRLRGGDGGVGP